MPYIKSLLRDEKWTLTNISWQKRRSQLPIRVKCPNAAHKHSAKNMTTIKKLAPML
ncbi:MAG: hypothetical protein V4654_12075 [Bdellovibrionota bacterium]